MSEHSRLFAPSAGERWINCAPSANAAAQYPDPPGESAMEGTAWHWVVERCLVDGVEPDAFLGRTILVREENVERRFVVTRDMGADAALAVRYVRDLVRVPGESHVEARVDLRHFHPECFGRCDVWHHGDDGTLTVADGKYGRVDVPVLYPNGHLNWQMTLYALGIIEELSRRLHPAKMPRRVRLVIIQPRSIQPVPRVKYHVVEIEHLLPLEHTVRQAVERVVSRAQEFVMGDWCKYCPALGACPPSQDELRALVPILLKSELTALDASRVLLRKDLLKRVVERAEEVAADSLMRGVSVPQFKLVTGVTHRAWVDEDAVADCASGVPGAFKVVTPAQMEKLPGGREIVDAYAKVPPGKPVVVSESDRRAPYVARSAEQMFGAA